MSNTCVQCASCSIDLPTAQTCLQCDRRRLLPGDKTDVCRRCGLVSALKLDVNNVCRRCELKTDSNTRVSHNLAANTP